MLWTPGGMSRKPVKPVAEVAEGEWERVTCQRCEEIAPQRLLRLRRLMCGKPLAFRPAAQSQCFSLDFSQLVTRHLSLVTALCNVMS
jgi:hypothetical protein